MNKEKELLLALLMEKHLEGVKNKPETTTTNLGKKTHRSKFRNHEWTASEKKVVFHELSRGNDLAKVVSLLNYSLPYHAVKLTKNKASNMYYVMKKSGVDYCGCGFCGVQS